MMYFSLTEKEKTKERIFEAIFEYAASCHVENIVEQMEKESELDEQIYFPEELDAKMRELIDSYSKKTRRKKALNTIRKALPKVAVFLIITLSTMTIFAMSVEAIRIRLLNFMTDETKEYTGIEVKEETDSQESTFDTIPKDWEGLYAPTYMPEGFVLSKTKRFSNTNLIIYLNDITGQMIMFEQGINKKANLRADTEDTNADKIMINVSEGLLIKKDEKNIIVWHNDDISFSVSGEIDINELIKVAESVKMVE